MYVIQRLMSCVAYACSQMIWCCLLIQSVTALSAQLMLGRDCCFAAQHHLFVIFHVASNFVFSATLLFHPSISIGIGVHPTGQTQQITRRSTSTLPSAAREPAVSLCVFVIVTIGMEYTNSGDDKEGDIESRDDDEVNKINIINELSRWQTPKNKISPKD